MTLKQGTSTVLFTFEWSGKVQGGLIGKICNLGGEENPARKLKHLADPKTARRIARKAARKGFNKVRDAARQNAQLIDDPETRANISKTSKWHQEKLVTET